MTGPTQATHGRAVSDGGAFVDSRVYTDPAVLATEEEHIFARSWLFATHESEIPDPGDFLTLTVAASPVLVIRGPDRQIRAFHNVCTHRSTLLVDEAAGHRDRLRCPYHWWEYSLSGELVRVPMPEAYSYDGCTFDQSQCGLVAVACSVAFGLVFVCLDREAPSLDAMLGEAATILAEPLAGHRFEVAAKVAYTLKANWKCYTDNARDGYHVPFVHPALRKLSRTSLPYRLLPGGHSVQYLATEGGSLPGGALDDLLAYPLSRPGVASPAYVLQLFPNLLVGFRTSWVAIESMLEIVGPGEVVMEARMLAPCEDSEQARQARLRSWRDWWDTPNRQEDVPVLEQQQRGLSSRGVRAVRFDRGGPGVEGIRGDDNRLRHFWARWHEDIQHGDQCRAATPTSEITAQTVATPEAGGRVLSR